MGLIVEFVEHLCVVMGVDENREAIRNARLRMPKSKTRKSRREKDGKGPQTMSFEAKVDAIDSQKSTQLTPPGTFFAMGALSVSSSDQ